GPGEISIPGRNNPWYQMAFISNELNTPKILVCPADNKKVVANNWSPNQAGGFLTPTYKNAAVSYFLGLHSFFASPRSILSGDRNIRWDALSGGCSSGVGLTETINLPTSSVEWTTAIHTIHGTSGNILFTDGGVEQLSIAGLRKALNLPDRVD